MHSRQNGEPNYGKNEHEWVEETPQRPRLIREPPRVLAGRLDDLEVVARQEPVVPPREGEFRSQRRSGQRGQAKSSALSGNGHVRE